MSTEDPRSLNGSSPPSKKNRKVGLCEKELETENFLAVAQSYWIQVFKKNAKCDKDACFNVNIRRIDLLCKRSGNCARFPLTIRAGIASFGDSRETSMRLKPRYSVPEMRAELARMVGQAIADALLSVVVKNLAHFLPTASLDQSNEQSNQRQGENS